MRFFGTSPRGLAASLTLAVVGCLTLAGGASAGVGVGQSGWTFGSPTPQGNGLRALDFANGRGYAVGDFGTVLRTDDGGSSFVGLRSGTTEGLGLVRVLDGDSFFVGGRCTLRRSDDAGQTFRRIPFTNSERNCPEGGQIRSLSFVSDAIGYTFLADGTVQRTIDGGQAFSRRTAVPGTPATNGGRGGEGARPTDIFFTSPTTGVATTESPAAIYRTTDAGESWDLVTSSGSALNGLFFVNPMIGYAVGDNNTLLRTEDGGQTFTRQPGPATVPGSNLRSIRCADATTCLIATDIGDRIVRTTDGGTTAETVSPATQRIFGVAFASSVRAVAVGEAGATVVSSDAGDTFATIGSRLSNRFFRLRATSNLIVHAAGNDGSLARTVDGGENWTTLGSPSSEDLLDVAFPSADTGFVLDVAGTALRTDNAGQTWQFLDTGTTSAPNSIVALDERLVLLAGPRGVRRSVTGGELFEQVLDRDVSRDSIDGIDVAGNALFAHGFQALAASADGGKSWRRVNRPGMAKKGTPRKLRRPTPALVAVDFATAAVGYAVTSNSGRIGGGLGGLGLLTEADVTPTRVWRTGNGGRTWRELPGVGNARVLNLAFGDAENGWVSVDRFGDEPGAYALRTTDAGKTWRPQLISPIPLQFRSLVAPQGSTGFALDIFSRLFGTTVGGDAEQRSEISINTRSRLVRPAAKSTATVVVTGRLDPAVGGADVVVSRRDAGGLSWNAQRATVSSNGTFTTEWQVRSTSYFVAQWRGDEDRNGDGSPVLTVISKPKKPKKPRNGQTRGAS